jgi:hypothetical protein
MIRRLVAAAIVLSCTTLMAGAEPRVAPIAPDWKPGDMRVLRVAEATASTSLGPQYAPALAADGRRDTKWVASVAPGPRSPQWITLRLLGPQKVAAVAVFGERVDNDGIIDGAVQVAGKAAGSFSTVAEVKSATSRSWLATFDPVKTSAVRLLVTRSGGPTTHTDVYEVEVFGAKLSAAELKGYAAEQLRACELRCKKAAAAAEKLGHPRDPQLADIERLEGSLQRLTQGLGRAAAIWPQRARELAAARQAAKQAARGEKVVSSREGAKVRLGNDRVSVILDEKDGTWEATWLGAVDAAVRRVRFAVEAGGQTLAPQGV